MTLDAAKLEEMIRLRESPLLSKEIFEFRRWYRINAKELLELAKDGLILRSHYPKGAKITGISVTWLEEPK